VMLLKKLVKLHIKKQMNKSLFYKDNLRYNVKRCIIFYGGENFGLYYLTVWEKAICLSILS
jgi:hypothetical protein